MQEGEEQIRQALLTLRRMLEPEADRSGYEEHWKHLGTLLQQQVRRRATRQKTKDDGWSRLMGKLPIGLLFSP